MDHRALFNIAMQEGVPKIVGEHILAGAPVGLGNNDAIYQEIKNYLSKEIEVSPDDIRIVGSARLGYSLSPDTFGVPFSADSDIDIIIINDVLFDRIWWVLSSWQFPWYMDSPADQRKWRHERMVRAFHGWFEPVLFRYQSQTLGRLVTPPALREIRTHWFEVLKRLSNAVSALSGRDCQARLYRTWPHARRYHEWSFDAVLKSRPDLKEQKQ